MRNAGPRDDGTSGVMFCVCKGHNVVLCSSIEVSCFEEKIEIEIHLLVLVED